MSRSRRRLAWGLAVWAALVALSGAWRARSPAPDAAGTLDLAVVDQGRRLERTTAVRIERLGPPNGSVAGTPPVLLLHGSPGSSRELLDLGRLLAPARPVLVPDLPGFGRSRARLPDYSIAAHADYVLQLLDALAVERVHLVGFSMGGGVAILAADQLDDRAASLTLLGSIGVQEYELFGHYHLNRAVHALQLGALWSLHNLVPHFGLLDPLPIDVAYARNFFDSDQRPLRGVLTRLDLPVLLLHGVADPLVPVELAREHHRLLPQSELVTYPAGHFMPFQTPGALAPDLTSFLDRVEAGAATRRATAPPQRLAAAARPPDPGDLPAATGLTLIVWMALLAAATLVSEDLTCIATGLLVAQGRIDLVAGIVACGLGIFVGDLALYAAGRVLGRPWLERAPLTWLVSPAQIERASAWFERHGPLVIFASRFWPGMRLPTYVAAGLLRTRWLEFTALFALAVAAWTPLLVGGTAWLGERWIEAARGSLGWILLAAIALAWLLSTLRRVVTYRGRKLWLATWRRRLRWEFWPPWVLYPPVLLWIAGLMVRHRSTTAFTAANPAIPHGGFVGESKGDILDGLPRGATARYLRLAAGTDLERRRSAVKAFRLEQTLAPPMVVKPDVGQRGQGVVIARDEATLDRALAAPEALLVQEYVPGREFGIFYLRHPRTETGEIFSLTVKELPTVTGDGVHSLERLILADGALLGQAETYLARFEDPAGRVPERGETVRLAELGTHCRGAVFRDGRALVTPQLRRAIDRMSRAYEGFHFGRYDVKVDSLADLRAGRGLRVLELNGVTSEATHIYDPAHGLLAAYRTLFRQWSLAFRIGRANMRRGARATPLRTLVQLAGRHLGRG